MSMPNVDAQQGRGDVNMLDAAHEHEHESWYDNAEQQAAILNHDAANDASALLLMQILDADDAERDRAKKDEANKLLVDDIIAKMSSLSTADGSANTNNMFKAVVSRVRRDTMR